MEQYWQMPWGTGDAFSDKMDLLIDLLDAVHVYLAERAGHKREAAVALLGDQVLSVWTTRTEIASSDSDSD